MNQIRCPQCSVLNSMSATECQQCRMLFVNLPSDAYVSVPAEEIFKANNPGAQLNMPIGPDNELGRKTLMWYRIYLGVIAVLQLVVAGLGIFIVAFIPRTGAKEETEALITGWVYMVAGIFFFLFFAVAIFFPRKPWNWIFGFVTMALGMTSCCFLPALIPLIIYWVKPETQAYFGRKQ